MTPAEIFGLCTLLVGGVGFSAKLLVEAEPLDVLTLAAICVALGYLWGQA